MHLLDTLYHNFKSSALSLSSGFTRGLLIGGVWLFVSRYLSFSLVFSQFCCTIFLLDKAGAKQSHHLRKWLKDSSS